MSRHLLDRSLVARERRQADRRSAWRHDARSFGSDGEISPTNSFPTTHARSRCELQLCEVQSASEAAAEAVLRTIAEAERLVDELVTAMHAAKAAQRAAHLAAGTVSGAKVS